ncbi:MAG TPA: PAS domain-containing protein, partial [Patescibacteria group bacterium]|nr:PAS domain-containing protein [Patescibacteria group bacterium]
MSKVDPTLMADQDGVVRMASSAAAELFGSAARDLEGLRLDELLESPAREVVEALFGAMARGSEVTTGDTPVRLAVRLRLPRGRMA